MTTRGTGGNASNRGAGSEGERTRRTKARKSPAEEAGAGQRTESPSTAPAAPNAAGRVTKRTTDARPRTQRRRPTPAPEQSAERTPEHATPADTRPFLPEEVVDEAAPLTERVPTLTPASEEPAVEAEAGASAEATPAAGAEMERGEPAGALPRGRRGRERGAGPRGNALGALIEQRFGDTSSPVRSYSELERRSAISREALSRYVTPRADRRRSPTIDTLAAIADALHLSLEQVCRAAVASAHGVMLPPESEQRARDEIVAPLVAPLTEDQFAAVVELLRQMQPR